MCHKVHVPSCYGRYVRLLVSSCVKITPGDLIFSQGHNNSRWQLLRRQLVDELVNVQWQLRTRPSKNCCFFTHHRWLSVDVMVQSFDSFCNGHIIKTRINKQDKEFSLVYLWIKISYYKKKIKSQRCENYFCTLIKDYKMWLLFSILKISMYFYISK